ncbi:MAG: hypothetical protein FWB80_03600 [Defluviitaleaceae bacterium]|nr:hypothetical protein [Defluviitaleaceae bacterium]
MDDDNKNNEMDDLEAQLSSLGLFGSDDDAEDDPFAALDALSNPPPAPPAAKEASFDDLDDILGGVDEAPASDAVEESDDFSALDDLLGGMDMDDTEEAPIAEADTVSADADDDFSALDDLLGGGLDDDAPMADSADDNPLAAFDEPDLSDFDDLDSLMGGGAGGDGDYDDLDSLFADSGAPMSTDGGEMDLDAQLNALLMADEAADQSFSPGDITSAMPTQSVYDPEVDGMGSVQYVKGSIAKEEEKPPKLFENMSFGKMVATFIIGVCLIGVGAVTAIMAHSAVQAQDNYIASLEHFTPIEIPLHGTTNDIFIHESAVIGGTHVTLTRISAGYSGTFIYFDELFDPDDFYILLYNQARHLYARTTFGLSGSTDTGTVLRFGPLTFNTLFLTLHMQCRRSGEFALFSYRFLSPPVHEGPVFINRPVNVAGDSERPSGINIRSAVFDSSSSTVHFSYAPYAQAEGFSLRKRDDAALLSLTDLSGLVSPMTNQNAVVYFDEFGIMLGMSVFGPVFSLESTVGVIFNGLAYFYPNPESEVTPSQLFGNNQDNPFSVETGNFILNLEGMAQDGPYVVLTMHGLNEARRRIPTDVDMVLRIDVGGGNYIEVPGITGVMHRGTDVRFNIQPYLNRIRDAHISQYSLVINRIDYDVPSMRVPIRVSRFYNMKHTRRTNTETAITEALNSLLAYKSGQTSRAGILGVSEDVINSPMIGGLFAPADFVGRPMFTSSVSTGELVSNYDYLAVAEVQWTAGEGADFQYFRETFKVIARSRDGIWTIVELIKI